MYRVTVEKDSVLAYLNERGEDEYPVLLPKDVRPVRLRADELLTHSAVEQWKSSHQLQQCASLELLLRHRRDSLPAVGLGPGNAQVVQSSIVQL